MAPCMSFLTTNKEWFDADPAAVFDVGVDENQRIADFQHLSIGWPEKQFGNDVIHARADLTRALIIRTCSGAIL